MIPSREIARGKLPAGKIALKLAHGFSFLNNHITGPYKPLGEQTKQN